MYETIDPDTGKRTIIYESTMPENPNIKVVVNNHSTGPIFDARRGTHKRNNIRKNRRKR